MRPSEDILSSELQTLLDNKTKPVGSLGQLEALAKRIALIQGTVRPKAQTCGLTIFAGDHGMANHGVSAYPQSVTSQMVLNFLSGGAAANVIAARLGVDVRVVNAGVAGPEIDHPMLIDRSLGKGTFNALEEPAMTEENLDNALAHGKALIADYDMDVVCFGEMGIGNTSSASLLGAKLLGLPVGELVGRGTGVDDAGFVRKRGLLENASVRTKNTLAARQALIQYGGFEIAMMAGAMIAAAAAKKPILMDGFIATAAALCACDLASSTKTALIAAHRSAEAGHSILLDALGLEPLLDLDMRLGEGTGALLAWPLVRSSVAILNDMASFSSAGVDGPA